MKVCSDAEVLAPGHGELDPSSRGVGAGHDDHTWRLRRGFAVVGEETHERPDEGVIAGRSAGIKRPPAGGRTVVVVIVVWKTAAFAPPEGVVGAGALDRWSQLSGPRPVGRRARPAPRPVGTLPGGALSGGDGVCQLQS